METHYIDAKFNTINRDGIKSLEGEKSKTIFENAEAIPEGDNIKIFQGIISQNFGKGEKSRNGYKYDQEGWFVGNYEMLPIILWQHDDSYGGIGFMQELYLDTNGNLGGIFYVDLDMLEERNAKQVNKGFVKGISTGARTIESMFEHNETGKRYTEAEAEDEFGWENVWKTLWGDADAILTYIVTKAELIENSLVTIGSNFGAIAKSVNGISDEMKSIANGMKSKQDKTILISKDSNMKTLEEANTKIDSLNAEAVTLQKESADKETKIGTLNDTISENATKIDGLEKDVEAKDKEINTFKDEAKTSTDKIKKLEDEAKAVILANAPNGGGGDEGGEEGEVKTMKDFTKKHSA